MPTLSELHPETRSAFTALVRYAAGTWRVMHFGALALVVVFSSVTHDQACRRNTARELYWTTWEALPGFTLLSTLLSLVLIRIVIVTALSYGLSQYALEMVIRVLVLELIPLTAALFVALRCTIPNGAALAEMRRVGHFDAMRRRGANPVVHEVLPRVVAGVFSAVTLAALSCVVALVLAYLAVYGASGAGLPAYTHMFGHVFNTAVSLIFVLKTAFFSLAVSIIPMASALYDIEGDGSRESAALQGLVRMFAVLVLIEAVSLVGNYY